jgi:hypothetical protein
MATIDPQLQYAKFAAGSVAHTVEHELKATLNKHPQSKSASILGVHHGISLRTLRDAVLAWRSMLPDAAGDVLLSKPDLGYAVKAATRASGYFEKKDTLEYKLIACLTGQFAKVEGPFVRSVGVEEIVQTAGKMYLKLAKGDDEGGNGAKEEGTGVSPAPKKSVRWQDTAMTSFFSPPSPATGSGRIPGAEDNTDKANRRPQTVKKAKSVGFKVGTASASGQKSAGSPRPALKRTIEDEGDEDEGDDDTFIGPARKAPRVTETNAVDATMSGALPDASPDSPSARLAGASSNSANVSNSGKTGQPRYTPWEEDEDDFIRGLIVAYRGQLTWPELAAASNAYFADKPILKKDGSVAHERGRRQAESLRHHGGFEGKKEDIDWWEMLDAQAYVGGEVVVVDWRAFRKEVEFREQAARAV